MPNLDGTHQLLGLDWKHLYEYVAISQESRFIFLYYFH